MYFWENIWEKSFNVRNYRISLHLIFWVFYFFIFSFYIYYLLILENWKGEALAINWFISMCLNIVLISLSYYLTIRTSYYYLIKQRNYNLFFVTLVLNILFFGLVFSGSLFLKKEFLPYLGFKKPVLSEPSSLPQLGYPMNIIRIIISYFALLSIPVAAKFFRDQLRHQKRENNLQKQNLQMQMDFLKAQIHPHFLFNTLNNIYSLNLNAEYEKASTMISRLSDLLRYVLYEGNREFIPMEEEIELIKNFIELEAIRSDSLKLILNFPFNIDPKIQLPPFLLLPLVENAFKHGVNSQFRDSFINIQLSLSPQHILLKVVNNFDEEYRNKNTGGLGLINLQKRLDYYYSGDFTLDIDEDYNRFIAILKIPILCPKFSV